MIANSRLKARGQHIDRSLALTHYDTASRAILQTMCKALIGGNAISIFAGSWVRFWPSGAPYQPPSLPRVACAAPGPYGRMSRGVTNRFSLGLFGSHEAAGWSRGAIFQELFVTNQSQSSSRMPSHRLYRVDGDCENANWTDIGAAWPNKDGLGFSVICHAVPMRGRMVLRIIKECEQNES